MSAPRRTLGERVVARLERALLRIPWPPNGRIALQGGFGFLKQIARSRALGLPRGRAPQGSQPS